MNSQDNDFSTREVTHCSVSEQISEVINPTLRQVEEFCAPSASRNELKLHENFKQGNTSASPADIRYDKPWFITIQGRKSRPKSYVHTLCTYMYFM